MYDTINSSIQAYDLDRFLNIPYWRCHKVVQAFQIADVQPYGHDLKNDIRWFQLTPNDPEMAGKYLVDEKYINRYAPTIGGYYVLYPDNYESYSPPEAFEDGYNRTDLEPTGLTFGEAIIELKTGGKVARQGWNGKGMYLVLMPGYPEVEANIMTSSKHNIPAGSLITINPYIAMKTATGEIQPGWLASQTDMLADDWQIVN